MFGIWLCGFQTWSRETSPTNQWRLTRQTATVSYMSRNFYRATHVSAVFAVVRCLSVCPSVTLVHCIHTTEDIVKLLCWPGSPIILVF